MRAVALLLLFSAGLAQENIQFTDDSMFTFGPSLIARPEVIIVETIPGNNTEVSVNLSNPGTISFTQVNALSSDGAIQRNTGIFSLKKKEAKKFPLTIRTDKPGIHVSKIIFSAVEARAETHVIILSNLNEDKPVINLESEKVNTLSIINAAITSPINGTLYYGLVNMNGEVLSASQKNVTSGETRLSISVPKEALTGKYVLFASINQENYDAKIVEVTTIISIQTLIIIGLVIIGLGAVIQANRIGRKEKKLGVQ